MTNKNRHGLEIFDPPNSQPHLDERKMWDQRIEATNAKWDAILAQQNKATNERSRIKLQQQHSTK